MANHMKKTVVDDFGEMGSFSNVPQWAQFAILAGAYQQGKAEALLYVYNESQKKINPK